MNSVELGFSWRERGGIESAINLYKVYLRNKFACAEYPIFVTYPGLSFPKFQNCIFSKRSDKILVRMMRQTDNRRIVNLELVGCNV